MGRKRRGRKESGLSDTECVSSAPFSASSTLSLESSGFGSIASTCLTRSAAGPTAAACIASLTSCFISSLTCLASFSRSASAPLCSFAIHSFASSCSGLSASRCRLAICD